MATTLKFDNLNVLDSKTVKKSDLKKKPLVKPYREYFGEMYIEPEEMRSRIELAEEIEDVMLWVFAYWIVATEAEISKEELKQDAKDKLISVIAKHTKLDPYLEKHIDDVINEVVDTTEKHADETDTDYWLSRDRAMLISENEANAFYNYENYREAKLKGKTKKIWHTELDEKVRATHMLAEGQTVDIDGLFFVGDSVMRFPMDTEFGASANETVNCRCVCKYE